MENKKNILLWLEDREEDLSDQIVMTKNYFDDVVIRSTPMGIKNYLEKQDKEIIISGIIIDIMLSNIDSLEDIDMVSIKTPSGFHAGIAFLKYFLMNNSNYKKYPVCILTMIQKSKVEDLLKNKEMGNDFKIIEKFAGNWEEDLCNWVKSLLDSKEAMNDKK